MDRKKEAQTGLPIKGLITVWVVILSAGAAYMLGRALTSVFWGAVADRYGRRPVIIFGTFVVVIFNTLFGLSANFWMAVITRLLLGLLNGLIGPIRAYAAEIFRPEYQALGMSTISSAWGIGLIIGPALGGFLAQRNIRLYSQRILYLGGFPISCLAYAYQCSPWLWVLLHFGCRHTIRISPPEQT
ncbi:Protein ZINC INDUCED FACILITATOR 1 [Capsicum chinense]|nr:Protein ZINC INDUCED FACILITATOR 1 [Capsicum chinense]